MLRGLDVKSMVVGAALLYVTLRFVAPKVPALNILRP